MTFFKRTVVLLSFVTLIAALFSSCDMAFAPVEEEITIEFEETTDNYIRYSTNDTGKYTRDYIHVIEGTDQNQVTEITLELKKDSGYDSGDYGVVFGYEDSNNYYLLSIDTFGKYSVKKKVYGTLYTIRDWNYDTDTALVTGYNQLNTITILINNSLNSYEIYFNSNPNYETSFSDSNFSGGSIGFFVYIGSMQAENFPAEPVDVSFKLISPVVE